MLAKYIILIRLVNERLLNRIIEIVDDFLLNDDIKFEQKREFSVIFTKIYNKAIKKTVKVKNVNVVPNISNII